MLKVGLDVRGTEPSFKQHWGRGTGRYAAELARALCSQANDAKENSTVKVIPLSSTELQANKWQRLFISTLPAGKQTIETQLFLPKRLENLPVDLLHFVSHGDAAARSRKPYIVTVLDLIPLRLPELYKAERSDFRFRLARYLEIENIKRASGILAISEATKRDIVAILGIPENRIFVTYLGVGKEFVRRPDSTEDWRALSARTRAKLQVDSERPLIIYAGGIDPRKNVSFLLEMFAKLLEKADKNKKPQLVLAGRFQNDEHYPAMKVNIERLGIAADVRELGFVSDADLVSLYHAADLMVFPTLYEGFGLPLAEAMACGLPALAANNSSIPEIVGKAFPLLPDMQVDLWVAEAEKVLSSIDEQRVRRERGYEQVRRFAWEETARTTLETYRIFQKLCLR